MTVTIIFAGLVGAILWNLVTWLFGLPSSSSHALFGGLIGATWSRRASARSTATRWSEGPHPGGRRADRGRRGRDAGHPPRLQIAGGDADSERPPRGTGRARSLSAALVSLAHGTNDAQKTMGVITLALITGRRLAPGTDPPIWVILAAGPRDRAGHLPRRLADHPHHGQGPDRHRSRRRASPPRPARPRVILASSHLGFPLSTTQVCSGSIIGAGLGKRLARGALDGRRADGVAWLFTLPAAAVVGAMAGRVADTGNAGVVIVAVLAIVAGGGIYVASRRRPVTRRTSTSTRPPPSDDDAAAYLIYFVQVSYC